MAEALLVSDQQFGWEFNLLGPARSAMPGNQQSLSFEFNDRLASVRADVSGLVNQLDVKAFGDLRTRRDRTKRVGPKEVLQALSKIIEIDRRKSDEDRLRQELEWLEANRTRHAGKWVALCGSDLLAQSYVAREVFKQVANHDPVPAVIYIEPEESQFMGW